MYLLFLFVTRGQVASRPCYILVTLSSIQDVVKLCTVVSKRPSRAMMARDNLLISHLYTREPTHSSLVCTYSSCNQESRPCYILGLYAAYEVSNRQGRRYTMGSKRPGRAMMARGDLMINHVVPPTSCLVLSFALPTSGSGWIAGCAEALLYQN